MPTKNAAQKKGTRKKTSKAAKKKAGAAPKAAKKRAKVTSRAAKKRATRPKAAKKTTRKAAKKTAGGPPGSRRVAAATTTPAANDTEPSGAERRVDERHEIPSAIEVHVELMGYQREGRELGGGPPPKREQRFQTPGTTRNLSIGGMLAQVDDNVTEGSHCLVRFIDAQGCIKPELRWGLVIRSMEAESGCVVAVSFDVPLEVLDAEGLAGR